MENTDLFSKIISGINKNIIRVLIAVMTVSLILASIHLILLIYHKIIDQLPVFLIDVTTLFDIFNLVLIIAVGYELLKSLVIIVSSNSVPTLPIIQIAIIAVANKIITLDLHHTQPMVIVGLAILIAALGITHFLLKNDKHSINNIKGAA
jgi:uncharacterized membrane protein (DUF373 family)